MKNLERKTKEYVEKSNDKEAGHQRESAQDEGKGELKTAPKTAAGVIMQAVAKAAMKPNTPGKSGKKATKGPKEDSEPTSKRQKKDFKKSGKKDIPFDAGSDPENEEMD